MILLSALCVVLSLEFGVSTPQGDRYNESFLKERKEGSTESNVERNIEELLIPSDLVLRNEAYNQNNFQLNIKSPSESKYFLDPSTFISKENNDDILLNSRQQNQNPSLTTLFEERTQRLMSNEYQREPVLNKFKTNAYYQGQSQFNNHPEDYRNINQQPNIISENKEYGHVNVERNFNKELSAVSHTASLINNGKNRKVSVPSVGNILSEVNDSRNGILPNEFNKKLLTKANPVSEISNINRRQNSRVEHSVNSTGHKYEEEGIQLDVPVATPEYINSILNEYKPTQQSNVHTFNKFGNGMKNNNLLRPSVKNVLETTFQSPTAEILYETGRAKPYEISKGNARVENILSNTKKLKDLYISSKPFKRYMVVYPDGRVEQVDQLEHIQKMYPNYVMLNAKELLQQGRHEASPELQESVITVNPPESAITAMNQPNTPIKERGKDILNQFVKDQPMQVPTNAIIGPSGNAEVLSSGTKPESTETKSVIVNDVEKPVQEVKTSNEDLTRETNHEENMLSNDENKYSPPIEIISTTEPPLPEVIVTTMKTTISTFLDETGIFFDTPNLSNENSKDNNGKMLKLISTNLKIVNDKNTTPQTNTNSNVNDEADKDSGTSNSEFSDSDPDAGVVTSDTNFRSDTAAFTTEPSINFLTDDTTASPSSNSPSRTGPPIESSPNINDSFNNINNTNADETQKTSTALITDQDGEDDGRPSEVQTSQINSDGADDGVSSYNISSNTSYETGSVQEKPDTNKALSFYPRQNASRKGKDDPDAAERNNPEISMEEVNKVGPSLAEKEGAVPVVTSNYSYYQNPTEKGVVDKNDDDDYENGEDKTGSVTSNVNDSVETGVSTSPVSAEDADTEAWFFNFNETFLKQLMSNDDSHNSFYFLFPRPKANIKETRKTIYPNGTVVIETTDTSGTHACRL